MDARSVGTIVAAVALLAAPGPLMVAVAAGGGQAAASRGDGRRAGPPTAGPAAPASSPTRESSRPSAQDSGLQESRLEGPRGRLTAPEGDLFRAGPETYAPRLHRPLRKFPGAVYPLTVGGYVPWTAPSPYAPAAGAAVSAVLRLLVRPDTALVSIDGYHAGSASDFSAGRPLEPGPHRIVLRAPGFEPAAFDVRGVAGETIVYRADLEPLAAPPAREAAPVPRAQATVYVIPRCYAGDVPPRAEQLPAGCDISAVRAIPPGRSRGGRAHF